MRIAECVNLYHKFKLMSGRNPTMKESMNHTKISEQDLAQKIISSVNDNLASKRGYDFQGVLSIKLSKSEVEIAIEM